ncbi:hypothetical protein [Cellvibrio fibrivorans]|uniref:Uncharacterized protein n=1 Tax=Cellvibrio fibrivorans TaxID=126350 RepID=A0ABU1V3Q0_9GAMM|nr:hypothetical protein [Cellvibrio fibrivorans]MDR7092099.1 hypothetical protein [Cellvibrio fibrivorans]
MTSRTLSHYTPTQIIERCACITLDDLLSRGANARNPMFKRLASFINNATAYDCGAHLLEWPDGSLVLVISHAAHNFSQLSPDTIIAAYGYVGRGCGLIYRDSWGAGHVA